MLPVVLTANVACLMVGGGAVALRKATAVLDAFGASARLRIVSPELDAGFYADGALDFRIEWRARRYQADDLAGVGLVFACTDAPEVNRLVASEAHAAGILVNVADAPAQCDFFLPATLRRGDLTVSFGSGGAPALSAALREEAEERYSPALALFARELRELRPILQERYPDSPGLRQELMRRLCESAIRNHWLAEHAAGHSEGLLQKQAQRLHDELHGAC